MKRRVLVTGAAGFIGRPATLALAGAAAVELHATGRGAAPGWLPRDVRWHAADLLVPGAVERLIKCAKPDVVLHLAWEATPGIYWSSPANVKWATATLQLAHALAHSGTETRLVGTGTSAEYDWNDGRCSERETTLQPTTLYSSAKDGTRRILEAYSRESSLSVAWGRVFFLYGPHEHPQRLVASVTQRLLRGEHASTSHGQQERDFLHVEDAATAMAALTLSNVTGAVNIASGKGTAVADVIAVIAEEIGRPDLIGWGEVPLAPSEPPIVVGDVSRLRNEVGFEPTWAIENGLPSTVEWWRAHLR